MRIKYILGLILSAFISTNAMAVDNAQNSSKNNDREVLTWLSVLDKNEVASGVLAKSKKLAPAVKDYAAWMRTAHSQNLRHAINLSRKLKDAPLKTDLVVALQKDGEQSLKTLKPLKEKAFQTAYINMMVQGHADALKTIDDNFKDSALSSEVKSFLITSRGHIKMHLEKAKEIQEQLASS